MKFTVTFKTPDAAADAIRDATGDDGRYQDEIAEAEALAEKFVQYGEYVRIEFDTADGTAKVVPVKQ